MYPVIFNTNGSGFWSDVRKSVAVTSLEVDYVDEEQTFGELRVFFDTDTWDINEDGLIYTAKGFMCELRDHLDSLGLAGRDVDYSEQGMQGGDYVSCDVGRNFLATWFGIS